jgi:hypothetical protein
LGFGGFFKIHSLYPKFCRTGNQPLCKRRVKRLFRLGTAIFANLSLQGIDVDPQLAVSATGFSDSVAILTADTLNSAA